MQHDQRYAAFLSYARKDEALAARLQTALETYRLPKSAKGITGSYTLGSVFRDRTELAAVSDLSAAIHNALGGSDYLIVLISEASRNSHWVNEEIRAFVGLHGTQRILCASIQPEPHTLLPDALDALDAEPLVADIRPANFRTGVTQLIATMTGLGLDTLLKRDLKRLRRRVMLITAGTSLALLVMGAATWNALDARSLAEERRQVAERQIEFMITDLKDELQAVGRLKPLDAVGVRAMEYYDNAPLHGVDSDSLARRARVFHMLGEIQNDQGQADAALGYFMRAHIATRALLHRDVDNADRVFDHSQSAFWVGQSAYQAEDYDAARRDFAEYLQLTEQLRKLEGETDRSMAERLYALSNLNAVSLATGDWVTAQRLTQQIIKEKKARLASNPQSPDLRVSLSNSLMSAANLELDAGDLPQAVRTTQQAVEILRLGEGRSADFDEVLQYITLQRSLGSLLSLSGDQDRAESALDATQRMMKQAAQIEDGHSELRFEKAQSAILDYRLGFLEGNRGRMGRARDRLQLERDALRADGTSDFGQGSVEKSAITIDLLHAVAEWDAQSMTAIAHAVLEADENNHPLTTRLLAHAVLDSTPDDLPDCSTMGDKLRFLDAAALSEFTQDASCLPQGTKRPETMLRTALASLRARLTPPTLSHATTKDTP